MELTRKQLYALGEVQKMQRTPKQIYALAKAQKMVLWSILINVVLYVLFTFLVNKEINPLLERALRVAFDFLMIVFIIIAPYNMYRLAQGLRSRIPWFWAFLSLIPFVNFLLLSLLSRDATRVLDANGYYVGLMGVNLKNIPIGPPSEE